MKQLPVSCMKNFQQSKRKCSIIRVFCPGFSFSYELNVTTGDLVLCIWVAV